MDNNKVVEIFNILSETEIDELLEKAQADPILQEEVDTGDSKFSKTKWRNQNLSETIFHKILPHITKLRDYPLVTHLRTIWSVNRYLPGGYMYIHSDGTSESGTEKSLYTMIVYLNDDFDQGETIFYNNFDQEIYKSVPKKGKALIFPQHIRHSGNLVLKSNKYLIRSDLMLRK